MNFMLRSESILYKDIMNNKSIIILVAFSSPNILSEIVTMTEERKYLS